MRLYLTGPIIQLSISRPVFDRRRTKKQAFSNVFHRKRLAIYPLRWYNETVSTTEVRHKKLFRCREHRLSWYRPGLPFRAVLCRLLTCYFYNILFLSIMQLFFAFSILTISNLRQKPDGQRAETLVPFGFFVYGAPAADRPLFFAGQLVEGRSSDSQTLSSLLGGKLPGLPRCVDLRPLRRPGQSGPCLLYTSRCV